MAPYSSSSRVVHAFYSRAGVGFGVPHICKPLLDFGSWSTEVKSQNIVPFVLDTIDRPYELGTSGVFRAPVFRSEEMNNEIGVDSNSGNHLNFHRISLSGDGIDCKSVWPSRST